MMSSNLKLIILLVGVTAILFCAWAKPLDTNAKKHVDDGFKRAAVSFGTARLIGAVISVAQGTDISFQPLGIGMKFAPGEALHSIADFVDKFGDLMFVSTVVFGVMKMLLNIGGNILSSLAVSGAMLGVICYHWRGRGTPIWYSKLVVILLLIRFAVPITMVGSDAIYKIFMADDYKASQSALAAPVGNLNNINTAACFNPFNLSCLRNAAQSYLNVATSIEQSAKEIVDHMINVIVVFLLQTMVIPLLLFWALFRVFTAMFQNSATGRVIRVEEASVLETRR